MLVDCLESLSFCDEIIVIDGGSEDRTIEIAKKMGAKTFTLKTNDFSKLRNFGLAKAGYDWILYVDVDERIDDNLKTSIVHLTANNDRKQQLNAYFLKRKNFYFGSGERNEWPYIEKMQRIFRRNTLVGWRGELHETPLFEGKVGELPGFLLHYTHRDLTSMLAKTIEWSKVEAQLRLKARHPKMTWWRFPRVMVSEFFNFYIRQGGWKVGTLGLIESIYQSFSIFITYARLWELQNKRNNKIENEKVID